MAYSNQYTNILNSPDYKHQIIISSIDEIGWFSVQKIDEENSKTLLILMKDILTIFAKNGVKFIKQYINHQDLILFKQSEYIEYDEYITITTPIEQFLIEMINVFGLKPI